MLAGELCPCHKRQRRPWSSPPKGIRGVFVFVRLPGAAPDGLCPNPDATTV